MREFVKHILSSQNQFASGGLLLMVIGSVGVFLRSLPVRLWQWIVQQTTMMITVKDDDAAFQWVKEWFLEQEFLKRIRHVDLDTTLRGRAMAMIPAPGRHRFWYHGRPFWVWLYRTDESKGYSQRRMESLTFRTIGRQQAFLRQFVAEVAACHDKNARTTPYLYVWDDCWTYVSAYHPRLLESVILKPGEKEHLVQDLERFRASRPRYRQLGVPYHRGYLLHGPPGTGKTSLVSGLSAKFGMSIYVVNLTEFNDRTLKSAMNDVPENSVILFEDIDCMRTGNRRLDAAADPTKRGARQWKRQEPGSEQLRRHAVGLAQRARRLSGSRERGIRHDHQSGRRARSRSTASGAHRLQALHGRGVRGAADGTLPPLLPRSDARGRPRLCRSSPGRNDGAVPGQLPGLEQESALAPEDAESVTMAQQ